MVAAAAGASHTAYRLDGGVLRFAPCTRGPDAQEVGYPNCQPKTGRAAFMVALGADAVVIA